MDLLFWDWMCVWFTVGIIKSFIFSHDLYFEMNQRVEIELRAQLSRHFEMNQDLCNHLIKFIFGVIQQVRPFKCVQGLFETLMVNLSPKITCWRGFHGPFILRLDVCFTAGTIKLFQHYLMILNQLIYYNVKYYCGQTVSTCIALSLEEPG